MQEYCGGLPFPPLGDLLDPEIEPGLLPQVCRVRRRQCSILTRHIYPGFSALIQIPGQKSEGQAQVTARPPWEALQTHGARDRVERAGKWGGIHRYRDNSSLVGVIPPTLRGSDWA